MSMDVSPNFTPRAQQLIMESKILATSLNHSGVTENHLLLSILKSDAVFIRDFLEGFSVKWRDFHDFIVTFGALEEIDGPQVKAAYSQSFKDALSGAYEFSEQIGHNYVGIEHLFFYLLNQSDGTCANYFYAYNIHPSSVIESFLIILKTKDLLRQSTSRAQRNPFSMPPKQSPVQQNSALDSFCTNLTLLAKKGGLTKVVGKVSEVNRLCEILGRKTKNNPLLLGEPGVGKTAVAEGLAHLISSGSAPSFLLNKEIYSVDLGSMIAGTKYRGEFEKRLKALLKECVDSKNVILFIDETHTLIGAGSAEGTLDAANMLKPSLARGDIKLIGATTYSEYKKSIEKDIALSRRFEIVPIEEATADETYKILQGIKSSYEAFHNIKYSSVILKKIVSLCDIYLPHKNFPDKAIDVIDEVGARIKIRCSSPPPEIAETEAQLFSLLDEDTINPEEESRLLDKYDKIMAEWENAPKAKVDIDVVLDIVAAKAKLPKENLRHEKDSKSKYLCRHLNRDIINQKEAVSSLYKSILRSKIGLKDPHKPIGSFLFLGSTGVGKTWTAKRLAHHYFGSAKNFFRFDMSEYSDKISSSKLIGASPGYVGYEEGGVLVENIKKKPHCVLLFDEIEKSHPEVQQLLLQILEEGELEDNSGMKAYFKDSIIILTSNIGSGLIGKSPLGFSAPPSSTNDKIKEEAKNLLSPELVNRLDSIVVFNQLREEDLLKIFKYNLRQLSSKLKKKGITLSVPSEVASHICIEAAEENMGARPLSRLMRSNIEDQIVNFYFKTPAKKNTHFTFSLSKNKIIYTID